MLVHRYLSAYAAACVKKHVNQSRAIIQPLISLTQALKQMCWSQKDHSCHMQLWQKPGQGAYLDVAVRVAVQQKLLANRYGQELEHCQIGTRQLCHQAVVAVDSHISVGQQVVQL